MNVDSPSFGHGEAIPRAHTAEGANLSPAISWSNPPPGTKSLALLVEDPDAPNPTAPQHIFVHWIVCDIDPSVRELSLGAGRGDLPRGARPGRNDYGQLTYAGPKPPVGRHRYVFRLFALDTMLRLSSPPERAALLDAMAGHILEEAELMGTYEREGSSSLSQPLPAG